MKQFPILILFIASLFSCDNTTRIIDSSHIVSVLPQPDQISMSDRTLVLTKTSKLYSPDTEVQPLLQLFNAELGILTGVHMKSTSRDGADADIVFTLDPELSPEEYLLNIAQNITASGGSYQALAMAKTTLLQLVFKKDDALHFPAVKIRDLPDSRYRGLMIDLARSWHSVETVKKLIDMAAFYKVNFLQLHFTDYQSYTLPSQQYPLLSTPGLTYSFNELKDLEAYSQLRGITIIPEIDIPGHSLPFVEAYPELFAIKDTADNPWIINMGKEEVYEALDLIIGEIAAVFRASPYFHIGGDEAIFYKVEDDPDVQAYIKKHELGADVHELYRHFLIRMNDIVKAHGKQMCVWEGFRQEGSIAIPKDIIVFEFETNRYLPDQLLEDGYTVVNTSWKPLYVVNKKKWEPLTIYRWNLWLWDNWFPEAPSYEPIQVKKSPLVIGAQMCAWEQTEEAEIPSLRKRLPTYIERIWNTEEKIPFEVFMDHLEQTDKRLSSLISDNRQDSLLIGHNFARD